MAGDPDILEHGTQPLDAVLNQLGLKNADLVAASTEFLTHKQVNKARKGRRHYDQRADENPQRAEQAGWGEKIQARGSLHLLSLCEFADLLIDLVRDQDDSGWTVEVNPVVGEQSGVFGAGKFPSQIDQRRARSPATLRGRYRCIRRAPGWPLRPTASGRGEREPGIMSPRAAMSSGSGSRRRRGPRRQTASGSACTPAAARERRPHSFSAPGSAGSKAKAGVGRTVSCAESCTASPSPGASRAPSGCCPAGGLSQ